MTEKWQYKAVDNIYHDVYEMLNLSVIDAHHFGFYNKFMSERFKRFIGWRVI